MVIETRLTPKILANQLQQLTDTCDMPTWLKDDLLNIAANIELIAPHKEVTDLPILIYFH